MTTKYQDSLKDLDNQRDGLYSRLREGDSSDGADQELLALMSAVCNNLHDASIDPTANDATHELAAATHISLAKMVDMAYSSSEYIQDATRHTLFGSATPPPKSDTCRGSRR